MKRTKKFRFEILELRTLLAGHGDFNGDGFDDLAIGSIQEDVGLIQDAGAVTVIYGSRRGLKDSGNQTWTQNSGGINGIAAANDQFGLELAIGDFDHDDFDDLAIGVPGDAVGGKDSAGAVNVLYGSASGLRATNDQLWTQDSAGVNDQAETGDNFGRELTTGDFNSDGFADLAISVPQEAVGAITNAGGVNVIYGSSSGLQSSGDQFWTQDSSGIDDKSEVRDFFGNDLTAGDFNNDGRDDLAVAVPGEPVGGKVNAGAVNVIYGSASRLNSSGDQFWTQDSTNVAGNSAVNNNFGARLAAGDFNGNGFDDLAIAAVGENNAAGAVHVLDGSAGKLIATGTSFTATALGFASSSNARFGLALASADFDRDGFNDLAVGAPLESVSGQSNAGAAYVAYGSAVGISATAAQRWIQGAGPSGVLSSSPQQADGFGRSLATGDFDGDGRCDLAIGVPGDRPISADSVGAVHVLYAFHSGLLDVGDQYWHQNLLSSSDGNEADDGFGYALG